MLRQSLANINLIINPYWSEKLQSNAMPGGKSKGTYGETPEGTYRKTTWEFVGNFQINTRENLWIQGAIPEGTSEDIQGTIF